MADKYRFKRIKEEIYRIEYRSRQMKVLILRDITSRLQRFSRRSRLYGRYSRKRTSMKRTSKVQYSRETETEGEIEGEISFLRVLTWPDIHLVADC